MEWMEGKSWRDYKHDKQTRYLKTLETHNEIMLRLDNIAKQLKEILEQQKERRNKDVK
tara:strand:+ start:3359 stop:3532 length:174 start_codon:yes stop_codon:yes gene_type:complete